MKRTTFGLGLVLAVFAVIALSAAPLPAGERPGFETYVVRPGDTLSKIAGRIFGDYRRWRELLAVNPQVTNPNRIYPGDSLLVPVPETAGADGGGLEAQAGAAAATEVFPGAVVEQTGGDSGLGAGTESAGEPSPSGAGTAGAEAAVAVPELPAEPERPVALVNPALYRSAGSISDALPTIAIVAGLDDRLLLGSGSDAIINAPVDPGTRFTVVRLDRRIFHPRTRKYLGWLTRVLGTAEVTCRDERTSTVTLIAMRDAASVGDYLVPIDPDDVLQEDTLAGKAKPECVPGGDLDGVIVAFDEDRLMVGEQDFAYIDRGSAAGVTPGRRFTIYRTVRPEGRITVGELQVLRADEDTATALITTSVQGVKVGDLLRER